MEVISKTGTSKKGAVPRESTVHISSSVCLCFYEVFYVFFHHELLITFDVRACQYSAGSCLGYFPLLCNSLRRRLVPAGNYIAGVLTSFHSLCTSSCSWIWMRKMELTSLLCRGNLNWGRGLCFRCDFLRFSVSGVPMAVTVSVKYSSKSRSIRTAILSLKRGSRQGITLSVRSVGCF